MAFPDQTPFVVDNPKSKTSLEENPTAKNILQETITNAFEEFWGFLDDTPEKRNEILLLLQGEECPENFENYLQELESLNQSKGTALLPNLLQDLKTLHALIIGDKDFINQLHLEKFISESDLYQVVTSFAKTYLNKLIEAQNTQNKNILKP